MRWATKGKTSGPAKVVNHYRGEVCDLLALGFQDGGVKPVVVRVKILATGAEVDVTKDEHGDFVGLTWTPIDTSAPPRAPRETRRNHQKPASKG